VANRPAGPAFTPPSPAAAPVEASAALPAAAPEPPAPPPAPELKIVLPPKPAGPKATLQFIPYKMKAVPKIISSRGSDFMVSARTPFEGMELQEVAFRIILPTADGIAVEAAPAPGKELPGGYRADKVFWLRLNIEPVMRAVPEHAAAIVGYAHAAPYLGTWLCLWQRFHRLEAQIRQGTDQGFIAVRPLQPQILASEIALLP